LFYIAGLGCASVCNATNSDQINQQSKDGQVVPPKP